jgi:hypothetical protein
MPFDDDLKRILDAAVAELTLLSRREADEARRQGLSEGRREAQQEAQSALDAALSAGGAGHSSDLAASERLLEAISALDAARSLTEILDTLVTHAAHEAARVGLLLVRGDRFRGWRFAGLSSLNDGPTVELTMADGGVLAQVVRTAASASGETGAHAGPPAFAALEAGRESLAVPVVMAGEVVAVLYADQGNASSHDPASSTAQLVAWPERLEVLARHAARCLEAMTAIKAARALSERPENVPATAAKGDVDEAHASARRYAKLLVSEIKLYHEGDVVAGRRERDLSARLGGEISRARSLYEQRIPATVRQRADYFFEELVRTLANGDATLLQLT